MRTLASPPSEDFEILMRGGFVPDPPSSAGVSPCFLAVIELELCDC